MKGTVFLRPLELGLQVEGENWQQGDDLQGSLTVRNHGNEPKSLADLQVHLAHGQIKKVQQKTSGAFKLLQSQNLGSERQLNAGETETFSWSFKTDRNFPITDGSASPYILYGLGDTPETLGQLQLSFEPHSVIQEFLNRFQIGFRFVVKTRKTLKEGLDIKLAPPDAKAFSSLEQVNVLAWFEDDALNLEYRFQVKKIEATAASMDVKKQKKTLEQRLEAVDYMTSSGRFNHDCFESAIREALDLVESKALF